MFYIVVEYFLGEADSMKGGLQDREQNNRHEFLLKGLEDEGRSTRICFLNPNALDVSRNLIAQT
jgi:hypothetical protein